MNCAELKYENDYIKIKNFIHHQNDVYYNTMFDLEVCSGGFFGTAPCEYFFGDFKKFIINLEKMYQFKKTSVKFNDIEYGNEVVFQMDKAGHIEVSGEIFGGECRLHTLKFSFTADQTVLGEFIRQMYKIIEPYIE